MKTHTIVTTIRKGLDFLLTWCFLGNLKVLRLAGSINPGQVNYGECLCLFEAARGGWGRGAIVEIGSFAGRSTVCLAAGSKQGRREKVIAIDYWPEEPIFNLLVNNIRRSKLGDHIEVKRQSSQEAAKNFSEPIRLLFIDGSHEYEDVKNDITAWLPHVITGGIIAFHDYHSNYDPYNAPGVNEVIEELILNSPDFICEGQIDCLLLVSKGESKNSRFFRKFSKFNKIRRKCQRLANRFLSP